MPKAAGNAVVRNRIKRQLREIWRAKLDAEAIDRRRTTTCSSCGRACPRQPRRAATSGSTERVDEVLGKVARMNASLARALRRRPASRSSTRYRWTLGVFVPEDVQVPPELLAVRVDALRKYGP